MQTAPTHWTNIRTARAGRAASTSSPATTVSAYAAHTGNGNDPASYICMDTINGFTGLKRVFKKNAASEDCDVVR